MRWPYVKLWRQFSKRERLDVLRQAVPAFSVTLLAAIGFGVIAEEVQEGETIGFDEQVLLAINMTSSPLLDAIMIAITTFGGALIIALLTVLIAGYLAIKRRKFASTMILLGVGGAALINLILKAIFSRARPDLWTQIVTENSFSFPSGHAMVSSALALSLIVILWKTKWRLISLIVGAAYVLGVGVSRMYLGVHYPTDIMAGWLVSTGWVVIVSSIILRHRLTQ